jgi:putative PIG3 family NAD(P)H quinone oxidoreductase
MNIVYAMTITNPGGPEALRWEQVPDPQPAPGEVVIAVVAAGVNRADLLQRQGHYPPPAGASPYPGLEVSGRIVHAAGPWNVGDEVCALLTGGGYAELVAVPAGQVLPCPAGVSLRDAAGLPEVAATVWSNLVQVAGLRAGERLLVHGGGGGIGTFAIQVGRVLGARVSTTARPAKHSALRELGAQRCIDYASEDFSDAAADVILDVMGASYLDRNLRALADDGRLVIIGLQGGRKAELNLGALLAKRASVSGTTLRARPAEQKAGIVAGVRHDLWPAVERGEIQPVIGGHLPITAAGQAHELVERGDQLGKVVLEVSS